MPAIETLSDKAIRAALKAAVSEGKARKLSDGGGLLIEVRPTGAGWWRLRYWRDARESMLSLGTYPEVGLALARQRRREALKLIAEGAARARSARPTSANARRAPLPKRPQPMVRRCLAPSRPWHASGGARCTVRR